MRIIIASRRLNFDQSAPKCSLYLASALAELGNEVHVLTSVISPQARRKLKQSGAIIHPVKAFLANKVYSSLSYTYLAQKLKKALSADIILGNGYTFFDDITWIHFLRLSNMIHLGSRSDNLFFGSLIEKALFQTSGKLLAPSSTVAEDLMKLYGVTPKKIIIQPHGVDTEYYSPSSKKGENEKRVVRLLFVGGKPLRKGFDLLLKTLNHMKHRRNVRLIAAGFVPDVHLKSIAEKLGVEELISFEGFVKTDRLLDLYRSSDLYVLPSLYDPFSIATLEAMATSLPVVVSRYSGICDILHDWHDGVIVDPFNLGEFTETLDTVVEDSKLRQKLGVNARLTSEKYSWRNVAMALSGRLISQTQTSFSKSSAHEFLGVAT